MNIALCTIVALCTLHIAHAQTRGSKPIRTSFNVGWMFGIDASQFFRDYQVYLGGKASGFGVPITMDFSVETFQIQNAPIGISIGYYRGVMRESYFYDPEKSPIPNGPEQSVSQTVLMNVIPTMLTFKYFPLRRQFATFVSAGGGFSSVNLYWEEGLSTSNDVGARTGGVRYDEWHFAPALAVSTGISLLFDDKLSDAVRAGVTLEVGYKYFPLSVPIFQETAKTLATAPKPPNKDYFFQAGGFHVQLGFEIILEGK